MQRKTKLLAQPAVLLLPAERLMATEGILGREGIVPAKNATGKRQKQIATIMFLNASGKRERQTGGNDAKAGMAGCARK
jgi:hypothetical protein